MKLDATQLLAVLVLGAVNLFAISVFILLGKLGISPGALTVISVVVIPMLLLVNYNVLTAVPELAETTSEDSE